MVVYSKLNPNTAINVTPNDSTDLSQPSILYVGGAGNVKVNPAVGGSAVTFLNVPAGTELKLKVTRVYSTGTTSSGIIAMY